MEGLRYAAKTSAAGKELAASLDQLSVSAEQKDALAERILEFAKTSGKEVLAGKENNLKEKTLQQQATKAAHLSAVEGVQCIAPRGKFDLSFSKSDFELRSSKQSFQIQYSRIQHIAIIDKVPKDTKNRVLLYIHLSRDADAKGKAASEAIVLQVANGTVFSIPSPASPGQTLSGEGAVVLCQAFGLMGVPPTAFVAPNGDIFKASGGWSAIEATVRVDQGWLFPLQSAFCFIEKPALWIQHNKIQTVEFGRTGSQSRTFDLWLHLEDGTDVEFSSINQSQLECLSAYTKRSGLKLATEDSKGDGVEDVNENLEGSDDEDSDFDPDAASEGDAGDLGDEKPDHEPEEEGEASDSDSEASVVSDEGISASRILELQMDSEQQRKRRRIE